MYSVALDINYPEEVNDHKGHEFYFSHSVFEDLIPLYCGFQKCKPGHRYGPAMRDHFYYHYIISGCGSIKIDDTLFQAEASQGFLIFPNKVADYQADDTTPWKYMWIAFDGIKATQMLYNICASPEIPIIQHNEPMIIYNLMNSIINCAQEQSVNSYLRTTGYLFLLLSQICNDNYTIFKSQTDIDNSKTENYLNEAVHYIKKNYNKNITVSSIAKYVGLDISYLGRIFKEHYGITSVEFLQEYRINMAYYLLRSTNLPIKKISSMVGYNDQLYFSKRFKSYYSITPTEARKRLNKDKR